MRRCTAVLVGTLGLLAACSSAAEKPSPVPVGETANLGFLTEVGVPVPTVSLEIPAGFHSSAQDHDVTGEGLGWYVVSDDRLEFLGFFSMSQIYRDACHVSEDDRVTPGPSVEDLAGALVDQEGVETSEPTAVRLAGFDGLYLEVTGPPDISGCTKQALSPTRLIYGDNQVDRLWILDVDGQRLVVDASTSPASTASDVDALTSMVESIELVTAAR